MPEVVETKRSRKLNLWFWVRLVVALIIGVILYRTTNWSELGRELSQANWFWISLAFVSFGMALVAGAFRWQALLRVQGIRLPLGETWVINMIGFFFNQFLPGSTGGDLVKVFYAIRKAPDKKAAAVLSIGMDRVFGLVAILLATFILLPFEWNRLTENPETKMILIFLALALAAVFAGLAGVFLFPLRRLPGVVLRQWEKVPRREVLESLYEAMHAHGRQAAATSRAVVAAICSVIPLLSVGWFLTQALGLDIAYGPMVILFSMVLCAMSVPLIPGGHGTREAAFTLLFTVFQLTRDGYEVGTEAALAVSTFFLCISLVWGLIGGAVYLFFSGHIKKTDAHV